MVSKRQTTKKKTKEVVKAEKLESVTKKIDLEQLRAIKAMEVAKREVILKREEINIITAEKESEKIEFAIWWMDVSRRVKLKAWMKEIVKADFKGRGLSDKETIKCFDDNLRLFGVKF
jgi:hypothetical protein